MKFKKNKTLYRGLAATTAALLALSTVGYTIAKSNIAIGWLDGWTGTDRNVYKDWEEEVPGYTIPGASEGFTYLKGKQYETAHKTVEDYAKAMKDHIVKEGEEGFALLKNDNEALPLKNSAAGKNVALFGWSAYNCPTGHTGVVAGNKSGPVTDRNGNVTGYTTAYADQVTLYDAFKAMSGVNVNETVQADQFTGKMASPKIGGGFGGGAATPWEEVTYEIPEKAASSEAVNSWNIDKASTTGIVVLGRGGGEGNNYKVDAATNAEDPLALSTDELQMIKTAKDKCAKVVVLIVSANAMELGPLVEKGGQYEVDSIGFCGIPNDYQYEGIANVLYGKVNATGGLTDTYVYDNSFTPASINMGEQYYSDLDTITNYNDPLNRGITNVGSSGYYADHYIVEAEGIYVGYKYYETRYYDAMANADATKATSATGSTKKGQAWDYQNEVVFPFGQSLSYIPYTQKLVDVKVNNNETGKVTATVEVTNNGKEDGTFLAQLYVSRPFTQTNKDHKVEKSAVDFLNSAKVAVKAGQTAKVEISLPTRYLASWDSKALNGAGTYTLDEGDYIFTAAAGAHEAVNNVLSKQGFNTDETTTIGETVTWNLENLDEKTYSVSNGVEVRNQMQNADINYFLGEGTVTYLSRTDWEGTFPKNYTNTVSDTGIACEKAFTIKGAAKEGEWLTELTGSQYKVTASSDSSKWAKVEGTKPAGLQDGQTVWQWIMSVAQSDPEAFSNIHSKEWQAVAAAINLDEAFVCVAQSGGSSRTFPSIGNPISKQSESVSGYQQTLNVGDKTMKLNLASNTLLGSSFNPELAYEWGLLEGEGGLWLQKTTGQPAITVWGGGLNQHRHAYNGRNSEYMSEDPMLTNRIGAAQYTALQTTGSINGPKHMGFNDQEKGRQGNACYMTEQKVRETDIRCYEGALRGEEGNATGVMMSFARIGATNTTNSVGLIKNIMRSEWGFNGIITTDMGMGRGYHELGALNMATVNEYAGFGSANEYVLAGGAVDSSIMDKSKAPHITFGDARKDPVFADQLRQTCLYMLYTVAHSGSGFYVERVENMGEDIVVPPSTISHHDPVGTIAVAPWEIGFIAPIAVFGVLTVLAAAGCVASSVKNDKEDK